MEKGMEIKNDGRYLPVCKHVKEISPYLHWSPSHIADIRQTELHNHSLYTPMHGILPPNMACNREELYISYTTLKDTDQ